MPAKTTQSGANMMELLLTLSLHCVWKKGGTHWTLWIHSGPSWWLWWRHCSQRRWIHDAPDKLRVLLPAIRVLLHICILRRAVWNIAEQGVWHAVLLVQGGRLLQHHREGKRKIRFHLRGHCEWDRSSKGAQDTYARRRSRAVPTATQCDHRQHCHSAKKQVQWPWKAHVPCPPWPTKVPNI